MRTISEELKRLYGRKVLKLSLSSGCTCPNRDGTVGTGGCAFCSEGGSGDFASHLAPLDEQIREAKALVDRKFPKDMPEEERRYIAYFQSFSNTYGPVERLRALYADAISRPEIVALSIGTRPDCLGDEMIDMLAGFNKSKPVWVELGLQTIDEAIAREMNRGYELPVFEDAVKRLKAAGLAVIVHVIFGLPGSSREKDLKTVRYLSHLEPTVDGVKLQMLQILKGTALGESYLREPFPLMTREEYVSLVAEAVGLLPEGMIVHRLTGDPPKRLLIEPKWCADKKRVINALRAALAECKESGPPEKSA